MELFQIKSLAKDLPNIIERSSKMNQDKEKFVKSIPNNKGRKVSVVGSSVKPVDREFSSIIDRAIYSRHAHGPRPKQYMLVFLVSLYVS
jgi:hypothetical protein